MHAASRTTRPAAAGGSRGIETPRKTTPQAGGGARSRPPVVRAASRPHAGARRTPLPPPQQQAALSAASLLAADDGLLGLASPPEDLLAAVATAMTADSERLASHPVAVSSDASSDDEERTGAVAAAAATATAAAPKTVLRRRVQKQQQQQQQQQQQRSQRRRQGASSADADNAAVKAASSLVASSSPSSLPWRSLRSLALLALLVAGPVAILSRNQGLVRALARAPLQPAFAGAGGDGLFTSAGLGRPAARARGPGAPAASSAASSGPSGGSGAAQPPPPGAGAIRMVAVVAEDRASPIKGGGGRVGKWGEVVRHMADRLRWEDERFALEVVTEAELSSAAARDALRARLAGGSSSPPPAVFTAFGITDAAVVDFLSEATAALPTALFWDSAPRLEAAHRADGYAPGSAGQLARLLASAGGWTREGKAAGVLGTLRELYSRRTSDDLLFTWLVALNEYTTTVPAVANTTKGSDLKSIYCMVMHCFKEIRDCVTDATCKAGLDCLQGCSFNDQVCQYRCIVSYETRQFTDFSLCILQKHNCRGLSAEPPAVPDPAPMASFRGEALTHDTAFGILTGWLDVPSGGGAGGGSASSTATVQSGLGRPLQRHSWIVAGGKNPAYDAFPSQMQLYYREKKAFWYEPVFQVRRLQGDTVWRRRKYRVRAGPAPGTFYYSVSDNGITSAEYWRLVDADDGLEWALFYYTGAASRAGMSYSGAVLGTPDGQWPDEARHGARLEAALERAGIKPWEVALVDNRPEATATAPLELELSASAA